MQNQTHKIRVLSLFKKILRSRPQFEPKDYDYITEEAYTLFRKNKDTHNQDEIEAQIFEAETRLDLALHYKIPQPRQYHIPSGDFPYSRQCIVPAYMYSTSPRFKGRDTYEPEQDF